MEQNVKWKGTVKIMTYYTCNVTKPLPHKNTLTGQVNCKKRTKF